MMVKTLYLLPDPVIQVRYLSLCLLDLKWIKEKYLKIKKIGIVTFHCVTNYGAVLQAFALFDTLNKDNNIDVEIIDFRPSEVTKNYEVKLFKLNKNIVNILTNFITYFIRKSKLRKFITFEKEFLKLSDFKIKQFNNYDILITGSDQVWNPNISKQKPYYLNLEGNNAKKISYAASIGKDNINQEEKNLLQIYLNKIDTFSVREDSAVQIAKSLFPNKDVTQVLDPVFLKTAEEWMKIFLHKPIYEDYILVYVMEFNSNLILLAKKLSSETKNKILFISPNASIKTLIKSFNLPGKVLFGTGPLEYLNLIYNANYICTNSFHGTAFSIIFQKKFITVPHSSRNTRLKSILTALDIVSQEVNSNKVLNKKNITELFDYDLEKVSTKLNLLRDDSLKFLEKAIG
jgi:hypothetical protein